MLRCSSVTGEDPAPSSRLACDSMCFAGGTRQTGTPPRAMATEITHHRSYLAENRRLIIGRALAAAAAGALPVPLVEDWLASRVARGTIRRIADSRSVDLDEAAVRAIADGPEKPPGGAEM